MSRPGADLSPLGNRLFANLGPDLSPRPSPPANLGPDLSRFSSPPPMRGEGRGSFPAMRTVDELGTDLSPLPSPGPIRGEGRGTLRAWRTARSPIAFTVSS